MHSTCVESLFVRLAQNLAGEGAVDDQIEEAILNRGNGCYVR